MEISSNVINLKKTDYGNNSLFLGQKLGLYDTIHKPHPEILKLFQKLRAQDWDEFEFDFTSCALEFKTCSKNVHDILKITLAWLWEADTVASRSIYAMTAPFITSDVLSRYWQKVSENESLHAATYSEILRGSFEENDVIIQEVLSIKENSNRLKVVTDVLDETYIKGHQYALGMVPNDQDLYNVIYKFNVAVLCLERIQFLNQFSVVAAVTKTTSFIPIGEAVKKICKDEFENHVRGIKTILEIESKTPRGKLARTQLDDVIFNMINEVRLSEIEGAKFLFSEGRELTGLDCESLCKYVNYNSQDVFDFMGIKLPFERIKTNPLPFMNSWVVMDNTQSSPQESRGSNYLVSSVVNDMKDNFVIDITDL